MFENLPIWMQQGVRTWNKGDVELENNSKVLTAATTAAAIRGISVIWLYIDSVAMELATEYGLLAKSREDIKDEMLAIDLEHRKSQLKIIDGGKS